MERKLSIFSKLPISVFIGIFALTFLFSSGSGGFLKPNIAGAENSAIGLTQDNPGIKRAIEVQGRHSGRLMGISGVVGHGIGISSEGKPVIKIFVAKAGIPGIPKDLEGIPTKVKVTGMIVAYADPRLRFSRPVPTGVSTGHPDITAGTIGCRVTDGTNVYALSNNHVYANENNSSIGDNVLQPGTYDGGNDPQDAIGTLFDFEPILFDGSVNYIDAAIALSSEYELGYSTPSGDGYGTPNSSTASAYSGQEVQKYGRTTRWTHGVVDTISTAVNVCYETKGIIFVRCTKSAYFEGQISITPGTFSSGGDSGSLIVTDDTNKFPVGLLFAGSNTHTFANPIDLVLDRFFVSVDDGSSSGNIMPTADFSFITSEITATFTDLSSDSDGTIDSWSWDFGDGNTSTDQNPSHTYAASNTYSVTLTVTDDGGATDSISQNVTVDDGVNTPPTADFKYTANDLAVDFTDQSSDSDGSIVSWDWDFGDGNTSTDQNPSHTYFADGTYTVALTVTDDAGATDLTSQDVTVSSGSVATITLTATGKQNRRWLITDLDWSGASSANVDIFRNQSLLITTSNDGTYTDKISNQGGGSYIYQVCEAGTSNCSNEVTVTY